MKKIQWSITNDSRDNAKHKEYERTLYVCKDDDIWVTVEKPVNN